MDALLALRQVILQADVMALEIDGEEFVASNPIGFHSEPQLLARVKIHLHRPVVTNAKQGPYARLEFAGGGI